MRWEKQFKRINSNRNGNGHGFPHIYGCDKFYRKLTKIKQLIEKQSFEDSYWVCIRGMLSITNMLTIALYLYESKGSWDPNLPNLLHDGLLQVTKNKKL